MQEQLEQPVSVLQEEEATKSAPRQPWQRPTLQHLHVSLDTAADVGTAGDGKGVTTFP